MEVCSSCTGSAGDGRCALPTREDAGIADRIIIVVEGGTTPLAIELGILQSDQQVTRRTTQTISCCARTRIALSLTTLTLPCPIISVHPGRTEFHTRVIPVQVGLVGDAVGAVGAVRAFRAGGGTGQT